MLFVCIGIYSQDICPSRPLMFASVGDNVTLCWQITVEINELEKYLRRFTVSALIRPGQNQMQKVASANQNGTFSRTYEDHHLGLYKDRVTVDADLQAGKLFLRITNYTNQMENVYCVFYEMTIINDVRSCFANAVILRTKGNLQKEAQIICFIVQKGDLSENISKNYRSPPFFSPSRERIKIKTAGGLFIYSRTRQLSKRKRKQRLCTG